MVDMLSPGAADPRSGKGTQHTSRVRGLESETHSVDVNDPVYLERMEIVKDPRSKLKR